MFELDPKHLSDSILICLSGGIGIYLMMPHRRQFAKPAVVFAIGLGLVLFASLYLVGLGSGPRSFITGLFFNIFAISSVLSSCLMITSRDPVHSALWFAVVVLSTSGLFLLAGAGFLAAGTVIVYAGAIIVTFLFVIMLSQSEGRAVYDRLAYQPARASLTGFLLIWAILIVVLNDPNQTVNIEKSEFENIEYGTRLVPGKDLIRIRNINANLPTHDVMTRAIPETLSLPENVQGQLPPGVPAPHVAGLGSALFTTHLISSELVGAILFVALAGAVVIATPRIGQISNISGNE